MLNVGGKGGAGIIALDLQSGKLVWQATADEAGYSSPVLIPEDPGVAAFFTRRGVILTSISDGKVLGDDFFRAEIDASVNAAAPVPCGAGKLLFSAAYDVGAGLWQWNKSERKLTSLWKKADALDCHYTTPVYHDGHVFGLHGRQETGMTLRCIAVADGKVAWEAPDRLQGGTLILVATNCSCTPNPASFGSSRPPPKNSNSCATQPDHPRRPPQPRCFYANGLLYARDAEKMVVVRVK
jgi:outer membrane protein assembly factor BamB